MQKTLDHPDYQIQPGIVNFSKWSRENIPKPPHGIPLGTLIEIKYDEWLGEGACMKVHARLFVLAHHFDCDGTALYSLGTRAGREIANGISEYRLTVVEATRDVLDGVDCPRWEESD